MVAGYVRLSKDDNKKDYVSIENQKLILTQYGKEHGFRIDRWYEDDGVSGYTFQRPGFKQMLEDLETDIDIVLAKDLSRIGRHNAKVLLFLEDMKSLGKRVVLTDDNYDSFSEEDDIIGIKTWYNERYVKDTSRKIKRAMRARQMEGTLAVNTPIGYIRNPIDKSKIIIDEKAAPYIRKVFSLYLEGYGFRAIAEILDKEKVPTASILERERLELEGKSYQKKISLHWSPKMVGEIIKNDIYIGNMRYHKIERTTIHGQNQRVKKEKHIVFFEHHPAIIEKETYETAMELLHSRIKTSYRGKSKGNKYNGFLYCESCGGKYNGIRKGERNTYYICNKYNSQGKNFCQQSIQIKEQDLDYIVLSYRNLILKQDMAITKSLFEEITQQLGQSLLIEIRQMEEELQKHKEELKYLMLQKIHRRTYSTIKTEDIREDKKEDIREDKREDKREDINPNIRVETREEIMDEIREQIQEELEKEKLNTILNLRNQIIKKKEELSLKSQEAEIISLEELFHKPVTRYELEAFLEKLIITKEGNIEVNGKDKLSISF